MSGPAPCQNLLASRITIRPDLVLRAGGRDLAVADAKYKELESGQWPHADLYQLLAYCASLGLPAGLLIYASEQPPERHVVERAGIGLEIVGVKMDGAPRDLDAPVRRAARRLVQQARYSRSEYIPAV